MPATMYDKKRADGLLKDLNGLYGKAQKANVHAKSVPLKQRYERQWSSVLYSLNKRIIDYLDNANDEPNSPYKFLKKDDTYALHDNVHGVMQAYINMHNEDALAWELHKKDGKVFSTKQDWKLLSARGMEVSTVPTMYSYVNKWIQSKHINDTRDNSFATIYNAYTAADMLDSVPQETANIKKNNDVQAFVDMNDAQVGYKKTVKGTNKYLQTALTKVYGEEQNYTKEYVGMYGKLLLYFNDPKTEKSFKQHSSASAGKYKRLALFYYLDYKKLAVKDRLADLDKAHIAKLFNERDKKNQKFAEIKDYNGKIIIAQKDVLKYFGITPRDPNLDQYEVDRDFIKNYKHDNTAKHSLELRQRSAGDKANKTKYPGLMERARKADAKAKSGTKHQEDAKATLITLDKDLNKRLKAESAKPHTTPLVPAFANLAQTYIELHNQFNWEDSWAPGTKDLDLYQKITERLDDPKGLIELDDKSTKPISEVLNKQAANTFKVLFGAYVAPELLSDLLEKETGVKLEENNKEQDDKAQPLPITNKDHAFLLYHLIDADKVHYRNNIKAQNASLKAELQKEYGEQNKYDDYYKKTRANEKAIFQSNERQAIFKKLENKASTPKVNYYKLDALYLLDTKPFSSTINKASYMNKKTFNYADGDNSEYIAINENDGRRVIAVDDVIKHFGIVFKTGKLDEPEKPQAAWQPYYDQYNSQPASAVEIAYNIEKSELKEANINKVKGLALAYIKKTNRNETVLNSMRSFIETIDGNKTWTGKYLK